jgi:dihydrofolate synthase/folylpolyglutamate synthase
VTASPTPEAILDRLHGLHPRLIDLSLDRLLALLAKLGDPHRHLPPVIHVAGTNGKGSTCAFLRAMAEAAGLRVHVYTSPHLVTFNERIRLAGALVDDATLAAAFDEVERLNAGAPITVFEVITAAAFMLFARVPADLVVLEVGLGGRGDATNVIPRPAACAIASISLDHQDLLGDTIAAIAAEKAGIIKPGVPVVTGRQDPAALAVLHHVATDRAAPLLRRDLDWTIDPARAGARYTDAAGPIDLPPLALPGAHQLDNAGLAIAALHAAGLPIPPPAIAQGAATADWPARMQRLHGALARLLPTGWDLWLDGGHNEGAAAVLADHLAAWSDRPLHLIVGMKQSKDAAAFLATLMPFASSVWAVAEPGQHLALPVPDIIAASAGRAQSGPDLRGAITQLQGPPARVLICGSLHLAGEVLKAEAPPGPR